MTVFICLRCVDVAVVRSVAWSRRIHSPGGMLFSSFAHFLLIRHGEAVMAIVKACSRFLVHA